MATPRSYAYLAAKWITGYVPSQSDFDDLFSSFENVVDDNLLIGSQNIANAVAPPVQGTAVQITAKMVNVTNTTGGDGGILTQSAVVGSLLFIQNTTLVNIYVFPKVGEQIIGNVINAPFVLPSGNALMLFCTIAGEWSALSNAPVVSPVKKYRAQLLQGGVAAPVAHVLENTYGAPLVWSYAGVGKYTVTLAGAFPVLKCFATICGGDGGQGILFLVNLNDTNPDSITIMQFDQSETPIDIAEIFITIESYP